ncbi:MAG: serine hydrolase [Erysipelotrichaceae bacterium]|nr:serine hydrolase [Erysipelotrichaceae bacterium]
MKKILSFILVIVVGLLVMKPVSAANISVNLYSEYAYLIDRNTGLVYLDDQSDDQIYPASITKILTTIVAIEELEENDTDLDDTITMVEEDFAGLYAAGASTAYLEIGEKVSYRDLLYGVLLPSGADACQALARLTYGSVEAFVEAMNEKVSSLGLTNSHFENPTGLHDDNHYTTVKDMSVILDDALNNETFKEVFTARTYTCSTGVHTWFSTLYRASSNSGMKTTVLDGAKSGYTTEAQYTLATLMTIDGHELILVTAYAKTENGLNAHVADALTVYNYMTIHYHSVTLYKKDEELGTYTILGSNIFQYVYETTEDISLLLENSIDYEDLDINLESQSAFLIAPVEDDEIIMIMEVSYDDEVIYTYDFTLESTIGLSYVTLALELGIPVGAVVAMVCVILRMIYRSR